MESADLPSPLYRRRLLPRHLKGGEHVENDEYAADIHYTQSEHTKARVVGNIYETPELLR